MFFCDISNKVFCKNIRTRKCHFHTFLLYWYMYRYIITSQFGTRSWFAYFCLRKYLKQEPMVRRYVLSNPWSLKVRVKFHFNINSEKNNSNNHNKITATEATATKAATWTTRTKNSQTRIDLLYESHARLRCDIGWISTMYSVRYQQLCKETNQQCFSCILSYGKLSLDRAKKTTLQKNYYLFFTFCCCLFLRTDQPIYCIRNNSMKRNYNLFHQFK